MTDRRICLPLALTVLAGLLALLAGAPGGGRAAGEGGECQKENLDLPFDALASEEEEDSAELIVFFGGVYESDSFIYCLDQSLSMADGEWRSLQRELIKNVQQFSDTVRFGMAFFAREVTTFPGDKKPVTATPGNKRAAIGAVEGIEPASWTCLQDGLRAALEMANQTDDSSRRMIILMSDGKPTCPGADFVTYRQEILTEAKTLNTKRIPINTIGVGYDVDDSFLGTLAEESGGKYRRLPR